VEVFKEGGNPAPKTSENYFINPRHIEKQGKLWTYPPPEYTGLHGQDRFSGEGLRDPIFRGCLDQSQSHINEAYKGIHRENTYKGYSWKAKTYILRIFIQLGGNILK